MQCPTAQILAATLASAVVFGSACGDPRQPVPPPSPGEPAAREETGRDRAETTRSDLIHRVRQGPCGPDGTGYGRWIEQQLVRTGGTLLFADWEVRGRNEAVDEVRFTYTVLDPDFRVLLGGYAWEISRDDGAVGAPRPLATRDRTGAAGVRRQGASRR